MRASTSAGAYRLSIIVVSLVAVRAVESPSRPACQRPPPLPACVRVHHGMKTPNPPNATAVTAPTPPAPTSPAASKSPTRSIVLLALAGFASQSQVRVTDSLLPQIAADFDTTVGSAALVVSAYVIAHGSIQLVIGPVGDRFGKYL